MMGHDGVSGGPQRTLSNRFRDLLQPFADVEEPTVEWMFADVSLLGCSSVVGRGLAKMNHLNWSQELSLEQAAQILGKLPESDSSRPIVLRVQRGIRESPRQYDYRDARSAANACVANSFGGILPDQAGPGDDVAQWMWADASIVGCSVGSGLARMTPLNWSQPRRISDVILELNSFGYTKQTLNLLESTSNASSSRALRVHVRKAAGAVEDLEFASPGLAAANLSRFLPSVPCGRPAICQLSSPKRALTSPPIDDRSRSLRVRWRSSGAAAPEDDDDGFEDEEVSPIQKALTPAATWSAATSVAEAIAEIEKCSGDVLGPVVVQLTGGQAADEETSYLSVREAVAALRKYLPRTLEPRPGLQAPAEPSPPELAAASAADPAEPAAQPLPPLSRARSAVAASPELAPIQGSISIAEVPDELIQKEDDGYGFEDEEGFEEDP